MRDEWRSTTTTSGVQCVTTTGRCRRLTSSVGPWDFLGQITRPLKQGIYMHVDLCNSLTLTDSYVCTSQGCGRRIDGWLCQIVMLS